MKLTRKGQINHFLIYFFLYRIWCEKKTLAKHFVFYIFVFMFLHIFDWFVWRCFSCGMCCGFFFAFQMLWRSRPINMTSLHLEYSNQTHPFKWSAQNDKLKMAYLFWSCIVFYLIMTFKSQQATPTKQEMSNETEADKNSKPLFILPIWLQCSGCA